MHKSAPFATGQMVGCFQIVELLADATRAMAAAPIWHTQHRALSEILIAGRRRLAALDAPRPSAPRPTERAASNP